MDDRNGNVVQSTGYFSEVARSVARLVASPVLAGRMLMKGDVVAFYGTLGDDLIPFRDGEFRDSAKPLWLNFGYWREARTYPAACVAMARYLASVAELRPGIDVLEVGCGFAEAAQLWAREYEVRRLVAIDLTPDHIDVARTRVAQAGLTDRIELQVGSATALKFRDATFDAVIALECAFHFKTRAAFFAEAWRVLRPGGVLAMTDMLPLPGSRHSGIWHRVCRRYAYLPEENIYDRNSYAEKLRQAGFGDVTVASIARYVYPGISKYAMLRRRGAGMDSVIELSAAELDADHWLDRGRVHSGLDDYVVVHARKPNDESQAV
jgi:microcystin synthetase protein McyJ